MSNLPDPVTPKPPGPSLRSLVVVALIVLAIAGGALYWLRWRRDADPDETRQVEESAATRGEESAGSSGAGGEGQQDLG